MNYKRRKPRTQIRCVLCTKNRFGNSHKGDNRARALAKDNYETL